MSFRPTTPSSRWRRPVACLGLAVTISVAVIGQSPPAGAAQPTVNLGVASSFAVLAASAVTNTGATTISGNVGVSPKSAITGFPPGLITNGTRHAGDATAKSAQKDLTTAYNSAAGRTPRTAVATELGGRTLFPGVYKNATLGITGTLTLDAKNDPGAVFVFQSTDTLITATSSRVKLTNRADACRVFWQVGSSATLGSNSGFAGSILAQASITADTGAAITGRLLARTAAVTLDDNDIKRPACAPVTDPTATSGGSSPTSRVPSTGAGSSSPSRSGAATDDAAPTLDTISPASGPKSGGSTVRVRGSGFTSGTTVTIGGIRVPRGDVHVISDRELTFVTPGGSAGRVTVVVTSRGLTSRTGLTFTYTTTTFLARTGNNEFGLAAGGAGLLILGLFFLNIGRPVRGRHAR